MGKNNQAYYLQRVAEELAAAERSTCAAAERVHRELSLRYSLKLIHRGPTSEPDETQAIGEPKRLRQVEPAAVPRRRAAKRSLG